MVETAESAAKIAEEIGREYAEARDDETRTVEERNRWHWMFVACKRVADAIKARSVSAPVGQEPENGD